MLNFPNASRSDHFGDNVHPAFGGMMACWEYLVFMDEAAARRRR